MERSKLGLVAVFSLVVVGIGLVAGILIYSRAVFWGRQQAETSRQQGLLEWGIDALSTVELRREGRPIFTLHPLTQSSEGGWTMEAQEDQPLDPFKIERFVNEVLSLQYAGQVRGEDQIWKGHFGLDYPLYEVILSDHQGNKRWLKVGTRLLDSPQRYAIDSLNPGQLHTLLDARSLFDKTPADFFRDELFAFEGEIQQLDFNLNPRGLALTFKRDESNSEWHLDAPAEWAAHQANVAGFVRNLQFTSALSFVPFYDLHEDGIDVTAPIAKIRLSTATERKTLDIFEDERGNRYGRLDRSLWAAILPESFQVVLHQPVNLLLTPIPQLPVWTQLEQFTWLSHRYEVFNQGQSVKLDERVLTPDEVSQMRNWYEGLSANPIIRNHEIKPRPLQRGDLFFSWTADGKPRQSGRWQEIGEGQGVYILEGKSLNLVVKRPSDPPVLE